MWGLIYLTILKPNRLMETISEKYENLRYIVRAFFNELAAITERNYVVNTVLKKEEGEVRLKYVDIEELALKPISKGFKTLEWISGPNGLVYRETIVLQGNGKTIELYMKQVSATLQHRIVQ